MREFESGATRNKGDHKYDYTGFESPYADMLYGQYMHKHRVQADGKLRDADNWWKGIPNLECIKSMKRHAKAVNAIFKGFTVLNPDTGKEDSFIDAICGVRFACDCLLHNYGKEKDLPVCFGDLEKGDTDDNRK